MRIEFSVHGEQVPQGSKTAQVIFDRSGKPVWKGGRVLAVVRNASAKLRDWRQQIATVALEKMNGRDAFAGGVRLDVTFIRQRPKSHYGTGKNSAKLKDSAPSRHLQKPDRDKLGRAVADAMKGIVYADDSQIDGGEVAKQWGARFETIIIVETEE